MEILHEHKKIKIEKAVFDFDGTISKLRAGWESVMIPMMCEFIPGDEQEVQTLVKDFVDESTGIQTVLQTKWLSETVKSRGGNALDAWEYKNEYLRRLMQTVEKRKQDIKNGKQDANDFIVAGTFGFLTTLKDMGVEIYAASGTDEEDVKKEAEILGFDKFFKEIKGAVNGSFACSKEAVLKSLIQDNSNILVVGDGKVEIALGREVSAVTLGVASNDVIGLNDGKFNMQKYKRLKNAGAHAIIPDFNDYNAIIKWL